MADEADLAQAVEEREREEAIRRVRIAQSFMPRDPCVDADCIDCGEPIEPARLAALNGSTSRCAECARDHELRMRTVGGR